jgi:hypothetical protein
LGFPFHEKGGHYLSHYRVGLELVFLWWPCCCYFCDGGHCHTWPLPLMPTPYPFCLKGESVRFYCDWDFASTCNFTSYGSFYWTGRSTHISNLEFLLLQDPTVLPYPLSYSKLESLELLYSWQHFFFCELFWVFLTAFLSFEKHSRNSTKELAWSFLPLPWHFCPMTAFLLKPFLRVPSYLYLWHSPVLCVVCAPSCFWHSAQLLLTYIFLGIQNSLELVPLCLPFLVAFSVLSFVAFSLVLVFATNFLTFSRMPNSFLML